MFVAAQIYNYYKRILKHLVIAICKIVIHSFLNYHHKAVVQLVKFENPDMVMNLSRSIQSKNAFYHDFLNVSSVLE